MPLVVRVARQALKCPEVGRVVVATDHPEIFGTVEKHGHEAMMTRADHANGTDRVAEVAATLEPQGFEIIINLQGDEPFFDPRDLGQLLALMGAGREEMATLKRPIESAAALSDPNVVKVVCDDRGRALYFSRLPIPYDRDADRPFEEVFEHLGVYAYRPEALMRFCAAPVHPLEARERLEQLRALAMGLAIAVRPALGEGRGIDTALDLEWARQKVADQGEGAFPDWGG